jgi:hypothetical protein
LRLLYASFHHPSRSEKLSAPLKTAFMPLVPAVEPCHQLAVLGGVLLDAGIQKEKARASYVAKPKPEGDAIRARTHMKDSRPSLSVEELHQGELVDLRFEVALLLPS